VLDDAGFRHRPGRDHFSPLGLEDSLKRVGTFKVRFEARMQILGEPIYLGSYQYRREAIAAESVALVIRKALDRAQTVKRAKEQSLSVSNLNQNQSEQAA
jgi:hypothetical protein